MKYTKAYEKYKARADYDDLPIKERIDKARKAGDGLEYMIILIECTKAGHNLKEITLKKTKAFKCQDCGLITSD